jgi:type IV pilus assembly protein PilB
MATSVLADIIKKDKLLTADQIGEVLNYQKANNVNFEKSLIDLGFYKEEQINSMLAKYYGVPSVSFAKLEKLDSSVVKLLPPEVAHRYKIIPLDRAGQLLIVAMTDPKNKQILAEVKQKTGFVLQPLVASEFSIKKALDMYYRLTLPATTPKRGKEMLIPEATEEHLTDIPPEITRFVSLDVAKKYMVVPFKRSGRVLQVAMVDPTDLIILEDLKFTTGLEIQPWRATEDVIMGAIEANFDLTPTSKVDAILKAAGGDDDVEFLEVEGGEPDTEREVVSADQEVASPIIRLVNMVILDALKKGASDIHIEPYENDMRVRFRIDGVLHEVMKPPLVHRQAIISRVKIMARMNISENRLPQDGRIKLKFKYEGKVRDIDFRVSCIPTLWGEKMVMRLLDKQNLVIDMTVLGMEAESLEKFKKAILLPYGMVLVVGPSGCGKTSTLYSAMEEINSPDVNIITAEDPVEFDIRGINQCQMHEQIGLNFASALRSFLRQDPDIILVGEIRDYETAEIAVKAALTGHLVLSTLHTNDSPTTICRLMHMGVEPFLVATSVHLVAAQRLVRRICKRCKEPDMRPVEDLLKVGFSPDEASSLRVFKGKGCDECSHTGYKGRIGLFEVLEMTDSIRDLIFSGATALQLREQAKKDGMLTLRQSGVAKVRNGVTTVDEVVRETID